MTQNATICVGTLGQGIWRSSDGGVRPFSFWFTRCQRRPSRARSRSARANQCGPQVTQQKAAQRPNALE